MEPTWTSPHIQPPLLPGGVQIWRLDLRTAQRTAMLAVALPLLNAEELARADRMRAGLPRDEFIATRGYLRLLLGRLLAVPPRELIFHSGHQGKPSLLAYPELKFNVTHSHGLAVIALSRAGEVGVDLEWQDRKVENREIAASFFHPIEIDFISSLPSERHRLLAFFRCWTRKEAVAKADGRGLRLALREFSTIVPVRDSAHVTAEDRIQIPTPAGLSFAWVRDLLLCDGFAGALALLVPLAPVECFDAERLSG